MDDLFHSVGISFDIKEELKGVLEQEQSNLLYIPLSIIMARYAIETRCLTSVYAFQVPD